MSRRTEQGHVHHDHDHDRDLVPEPTGNGRTSAAPGPVRPATGDATGATKTPKATETISEHVSGILKAIGEDPGREGLLLTPERVAKSMQFLTQGYQMDPRTILEKAIFHEDYSEIILVKDIEIFSLCEHHMLPFIGKAHVAYIPNGRIVGLSKIPRVVDIYARRLQVQERLTLQIRDAIQEVLEPQGVGVIIEARHLCMIMRGVQKQHSITTTSAMSGQFFDPCTREEFMRLVRGSD